MKKIKFLTPVMATVAALTPATALLTSCGKINYSDQIAELKDSTITTFMDMAKTCHRITWDEGEAFEYIIAFMKKLGFTPSGYDHWSKIEEVRNEITKNLKPGRPKVDDYQKFKEWGNVWFDIPASKGMEDAPKLIITTHTDSSIAFADKETDVQKWVEETDNIIDVQFDRDNDILETKKRTSLGADGGLGIAFLLNIAKKRSQFKHGELRLLFTAGESEGTKNFASGSAFLYNDQVHDGWLVDEEGKHIGERSYLEQGSSKPFGEEGEYKYIISTGGIYKNCIYQSAAGIHDCEFADYNLKLNINEPTDVENSNAVPWSTKPEINLYTLKIDGLHGGQSAKYINSGYANALQLISQMLFTADEDFRIVNGWSLPGPRSIPTQAEFTFITKVSKDDLESKIGTFAESFKTAYPNDDWDKFTHTLTLHDRAEASGSIKYSMSPRQSRSILKLLAYGLYYGPVDYFDKEQTKVRTSCCFADLDLDVDQKGDPNSKIHFHNVCRSASSDMLFYFHRIASTVLFDACQTLYTYDHEGTTPWKKAESRATHVWKSAWEQKTDNKIVNMLSKGFDNMGIKGTLWDNHGWIDAATIPTIYEYAFESTTPYITCLGPEIRSSNEVDETVWLDTMSTAMGALLYVMEHMNNI